MLASFEPQCISSIRHLSTDAFDLSLLDNCNYFLSGCPQYLLNQKKFKTTLLALSWQFQKLTISVLILPLSASCPLIYEYSTNSLLCATTASTGEQDSSAVRVPDSWSKGPGFKPWQEQQENFLLQGQLSVLTLISVYVPPPCYRSSTYSAKSAGGRLQLKHAYTLRMWLLLNRASALVTTCP